LLYRGLANERRLFILSLLVHRPYTGVELRQRLGICQPCVTKHLRVLMTAQLVFGERVRGAVKFKVGDASSVRRYLNQAL
ncbi:MAG: winged helix-turn-helix transcriptional regulator, partial [Candidatus Kerfeldbacteria bacterium]|nr:winged helix-turn-helix transcriptional regulator [Candidatus Kerfeldbacteria bacterium]